MSTNPKKLYLSYQQTDQLIRDLNRIDMKLSTRGNSLEGGRRDLLLGIKEDILAELKRRQLSFRF